MKTKREGHNLLNVSFVGANPRHIKVAQEVVEDIDSKNLISSATLLSQINKVNREIVEYKKQNDTVDVPQQFHQKMGELHRELYGYNDAQGAYINGASQKFKSMREDIEKNVKGKPRQFYLNYVQDAILKNDVANCIEKSILALSLLKEKGIENVKRLSLNAKEKFIPADEDPTECFTVIDMDDKAKVEDPDTWGDGAIIADPFAKFVAPVKDACKYFKRLFGIKADGDDLKTFFEFQDLEKGEVEKFELSDLKAVKTSFNLRSLAD